MNDAGTRAPQLAADDGTGRAEPRRPVLEVAGVRTAFGGVQALDGVDLALEPGVVAGLIGPNGAGKSTLFNVMTGLVSPDEGVVRRNGAELSRQTLERAARAGIGRTFQTPRGFASMTVLENLLIVPAARSEGVVGALVGGGAAPPATLERAEQVLRRLGLERLGDVPYDELSGGDLRLLEIGRHLMRDIDVLLLDEPTAGVIPTMQERISDAIRSLAASGITVLVVEHNLRFVFDVAKTVSVMVGGRIIFSGSPDDVQRHPEVIAAYLGTNEAP